VYSRFPSSPARLAITPRCLYQDCKQLPQIVVGEPCQLPVRVLRGVTLTEGLQPRTQLHRGIARISRLGTLAYLAPEQLAGARRR